MVGDWPLLPIGSLGQVYDGPHATPPTQADGPVFLGIDTLENGRLNLAATKHVSLDTFKQWTRRVRPQPDDLVFSYETRIGQAALIPEGLQCCLGRRLALVRVDRRKILPAWLLYYFLGPIFQEVLRAHTKPGSTVDRIHLKDFPTFPVAIPPMAEQERIVDLLGALDEKIDLNRQTAKTLEAQAQALFKSWFIDFEPVYAKARGCSTGFLEPVEALFPSTFQDGGLPAGWRDGSIADLARVNPTTPLRSGAAAYVDMAAIPTAGPLIQRVVHRKPGSGARFQNGDTLIARITPCLENGKTALVDCLSSGEVGWGSTEFIVLRPNEDAPSAIPYLLARHGPFREMLVAAMSGTSGRQRVQANAVLRWPLAIPPRDVIRAFGELTDPIFKAITQLGEQRRTLATLRDTLLPRLITGELRIRPAEQAVAAA